MLRDRGRNKGPGVRADGQAGGGCTSGLGGDGNTGLRGKQDSVIQDFDLQVKELAHVICFRQSRVGAWSPL